MEKTLVVVVLIGGEECRKLIVVLGKEDWGCVCLVSEGMLLCS